MRPIGEPLLEDLFRAALDHVQQPGRAGTFADRGEVDDHGDVLVGLPGVAPHVLVDPDRSDAVEPVDVVDQNASAFGEDRVIGGVPRDPEPFGDAGDGEVLTHDPFQRLSQTATRQLRPRFGGLAGVLAPHVAAAGAPVAADDDHQRRGAPAQRLVCQPPGHGVTGRALAAAAATPLVRLDDTARKQCPLWLEALADDLKPKPVEAAERGEVRAGEGSVRHVEISQKIRVEEGLLPGRRPRARNCLVPGNASDHCQGRAAG